MTRRQLALRHALPDVGRALRPWAPPIHRREFWAVQVLVLLIAGGHAGLETFPVEVEPPALYLLPSSLYFVPTVYAALNFGVRGSLATALWSAVLTIPNTLLLHSGLERIGEAWQMAIVLAVAAFVGQRVDRETRARRDAEQRELERRTSDARYRRLFDNAAEGVLLLDANGTILEANAAAAEFLGSPLDQIGGARLESIVGARIAHQLIDQSSPEVIALPAPSGHRARWVEPIAYAGSASGDPPIETQLILHDVTSQHERQRDLEAYARQTLAAREEAQRRIGRELHDGPLQSLVLLWRKLDSLDNAPDPRQAAAARDARQLAESTADELRQISRALRPSVLDDLGVAAALKSEANALARRSRTTVRFVETGDAVPLDAEIELTVLRVVQEALHNVERHAAASRASVRLSWETDHVRVTVRDDGRGFAAVPSASDLLDAGKLGLVGIQERVRLVGGEVTLGGRAGEGTIVDAVIPVAARDPTATRFVGPERMSRALPPRSAG